MAFDEESGLFDVGEFDVASFDNVSFSDNVSSSDLIEKETRKTLTDNSNVSDDYNRTASLNKDLTDNISSSDVMSKSIQREVFDTLTVVDNYNRTASLNKSLTDNITTTDDYSRTANLNRLFTDEVKNYTSESGLFDIGTFDNALFDYTTLSDGITDKISKQVNRSFVDNVSSDDVFSKLIIKSLMDNLSISEDKFNTQGKNFWDYITITDNICLNKISGVINTIQDDFHTVLNDIMNEEVKLVKQSVEMTNGFIDEIAELEFCITCRIMPMSQKDRNLIEIGNLSSGNMIGYFYPTYDFRGTDYEVDNDDIINDLKNSVKYRVVSIVQREHLNNKIVYVKAVLQRI
jgi:hypothetical protein